MKLRNSLFLLLTATIWGVAFVAQSVGMQYVGPFTFVFARNVIGGLVLLPVIAVLGKSGGPHPKQAPVRLPHAVVVPRTFGWNDD